MCISYLIISTFYSGIYFFVAEMGFQTARMPKVCNAVIAAKGAFFDESKV